MGEKNSGPTKATLDHPRMTGRDGAIDYAAKLEQVAPDLAPQTISLQAGDDVVLQYLGSAVVLQWSALPDLAKSALLQQAAAIGGLPMVPSLRDQIELLIRRNQ